MSENEKPEPEPEKEKTEIEEIVAKQTEGLKLPQEAIDSINEITKGVAEALSGGDIGVKMLEEMDTARDGQLLWISNKLVSMDEKFDSMRVVLIELLKVLQ